MTSCLLEACCTMEWMIEKGWLVTISNCVIMIALALHAFILNRSVYWTTWQEFILSTAESKKLQSSDSQHGLSKKSTSDFNLVSRSPVGTM